MNHNLSYITYIERFPEVTRGDKNRIEWQRGARQHDDQEDQRGEYEAGRVHSAGEEGKGGDWGVHPRVAQGHGQQDQEWARGWEERKREQRGDTALIARGDMH